MLALLSLRRWLVRAGLLFAPVAGVGQTLAPTLLDDFNRSDDPAVGTGWVEAETTPGPGAAIVGNQLKLSSGARGKDFVSRDVSTPYSPVLRRNSDPLTWLFSLQQSRPNPSGFAPNNYGGAFVLAGSAAGFTTGNGYAVVYGNTGQPGSHQQRHGNGRGAHRHHGRLDARQRGQWCSRWGRLVCSPPMPRAIRPAPATAGAVPWAAGRLWCTTGTAS